MTGPKKVFLIVGLTAILGGQLIYTALLMKPDGIRMHYPGKRAAMQPSFTAAGDAWMKGGIGKVEIRAQDEETKKVSLFPAERDAVKYRGKPIFLLAAYQARITLPAGGRFALSAMATGTDGRVLETPPRTVSISLSAPSKDFSYGSVLHVVPLIILLVLWIAVPLLVKRSGSDLVRDRVALVISLVLWIDEISFQIWWFSIGAWTVTNSIMIHMCGLAILFIPVLYFTENAKFRQYLFEILYFFGLGGAVQALFSPDIGLHGFPEFKYLAFFISHGTIALAMIYAAVLYRVELTWKSVIRILVVTNILTFFAYGVNLLLRFVPPYEAGNYFAMGYPPPNGSIIDVFSDIFGPSPRYLIGLEIMGIAVLALLYLPYPIGRLVAGRKRRQDHVS